MPTEPSPQRRRAADGEVGAGAVGLLRRKPSVTLDQFDRYWRDVHGAIAARIPMWQGFQYHLGEPAEDLWPAPGGVERALPERVRFQGVSDARYRSGDEQRSAGGGAAFPLLMADEQNVFGRTLLFPFAPGGAKTLRDELPDAAPDGPESHLRVLAFFRARGDGDRAREFLLDGLAPALAGTGLPAKVRATAFADGAGRGYPAEAVGVDHELPEELAYSGMLELAFDDRLATRRMFDSGAFAATVDAQRESFGAIHAFPVRETYAYRYRGRPTLMGERGGPAARLIRELGAVNQAGDEVRSLLFGDAGGRA